MADFKQGWEIDFDEIKFVGRIDVSSPGNYGEVHKASWNGIHVAVKVLQSSMMAIDPQSKEDFAKEAEFLMRSGHKNVVRFWGAGVTSDEVPFLVLELMSRGSLKDLIDAERRALDEGVTSAYPLTLERRLQIATNVANGMAYMHSRHKMHRDLKSGNVLINERGIAKVGDFGTIRELVMGHKTSRSENADFVMEMLEGDSGSESGSRKGWRQRLRRKRAGNSDSRDSSRPASTSESPASSANASSSGFKAGEMMLTVGVGTPAYMAPEVIRGQSYNYAADVSGEGRRWGLKGEGHKVDVLRTRPCVVSSCLRLVHAPCPRAVHWTHHAAHCSPRADHPTLPTLLPSLRLRFGATGSFCGSSRNCARPTCSGRWATSAKAPCWAASCGSWSEARVSNWA